MPFVPLSEAPDLCEVLDERGHPDLHVTQAIVDPTRGLSAAQTRICMLRAAGMDTSAIAQWLETTEFAILNHLRNPKCQRLLLKLGAFTVSDLRPIIEIVNGHIAEATKEAFDAEMEVMRFSRARMSQNEDVKAGHLCHQTASSILDRAGAAAPKRIESRNVNANIPLTPETASTLMNVLKELDESP